LDTDPPINPRKCFIEEKLVFEGPNATALLIRIDPPIISAPQWAPPATTLSEAVVVAKFVGATLDPINEWPMYVYICSIVNDQFEGSGRVSSKDVSNDYWGELYPTFEDADKAVEVHRRYDGGLGV